MLWRLAACLILLSSNASAGEVGSYPNASALNGTERMLSDQGGATVNITPLQIQSFILPGGALPITSGGTGATLASTALNNLLPSQAGNNNNCLGTNGTTAAWIACSYNVAANPSATITLTQQNGVAATYMRSDAAPALSQAISPTWTGNHIFSAATATPATFNSSGVNFGAVANGTGGFEVATLLIPGFVMNSSGPNYGYVANVGTQLWGLGYSSSTTALGTSALTWNNTGDVSIPTPSSGVALTANGSSGAYAAVFSNQGGTGASFGPIITAGTNAADQSFLVYNKLANALYLQVRGDGYTALGSGGPVTINTTGATTITPTSGNALTLNGVAGAYSGLVTGSASAGNSYGLLTNAGTNSADISMLVRNQSGANNYFLVRGDGFLGLGIGLPVSIATSGQMSITPNSAVSPLILNGVGAAYTEQILAASTTGASYGELVQAGTNATDANFYARNYNGSTNFEIIYGNGGIVVGSPSSGGNEGPGTINMQGCFVNGVACSTGGASAANPTATIGLSVVNGSAGTYMRSDAAPPLSQAISPTWTGNHVHSPGSGVAIINNGVANQWTEEVLGAGTSGQSFGLLVEAGSTAGDTSFDVLNAGGSSQYFRIYGDGGIVTGSAADQGAGSFNVASTLFIGGNQIFFGVPASSSTTAAVTDVGKTIVATGNISINNGVFSQGHALSIYNNSGSAITIQGSITTMRLAGTATTGARTLAQRGLATLWFNSSSEVIVTGAGVT